MNLWLPAVGAILLSPLVAQENLPSTRHEPALPVSAQALPIGERSPIVVDVVRVTDAWFVRFAGRAYDLAGRYLDAEFTTELEKAVRSKAATPPAFLVRADARAPYRVPYLALKAAAEAGLTRILFAARNDAAPTAACAVVWQLPGPDEPPDPEGLPDIRLTARLKHGRVYRTFEIDTTPIPPGPEGDEKLDGFLRAKRDEQRKLWKAEIPVVVEAEDAVPWQHIVDLVSLAQRSGCTRIELDLAAQPEEPAAARQRQRNADDVEPARGELTSWPTAEVTLPRSTSAVVFAEKHPIELWIFPGQNALAATRPADEWQWQIKQRIYRFDQAGWKGLTVNLAQRAGVFGNGLSSRILLIRADARAPYGLIQKALEAAGLARIYKIHIAAVRDAAAPLEAVRCWLPVNKAGPGPGALEAELRLLLSWDPQASRLERLFGQSVCPPTPEGDAKLESAARASLAAMREHGRPAVLVIDAGPQVPCQAILDAVDLASKLGLEQVEFGFGAEHW